MDGQLQAPAALPPGKTPLTYCTVIWAGLGAKRKSLPPLGFEPRTVQPVASRCTEYAVWILCVCVCVCEDTMSKSRIQVCFVN
jgi:hypothetical protein